MMFQLVHSPGVLGIFARPNKNPALIVDLFPCILLHILKTFLVVQSP